MNESSPMTKAKRALVEINRLVRVRDRASELIDQLKATVAIRVAYDLPLDGAVSTHLKGTSRNPMIVIRHEGVEVASLPQRDHMLRVGLATSRVQVVSEYGPRCDTYQKGCPTCEAWAYFDHYGRAPSEDELQRRVQGVSRVR